MIDIINELFRSPPPRPKPKPESHPMRLFNSLQIVGLFAGFPYLLQWLATNPFKNADSAFYVAAIFYAVSFIFLVVSVRDSMRKDGPFGWF